MLKTVNGNSPVPKNNTRNNTLKKTLCIISFLCVAILHIGKAQVPNALKNDNNYTTFAKRFQQRSFSPDAFKEALTIAGLPTEHIDQIFTHARRESGNFKSVLFRKQNNAFGMRLPKRRTTTAVARERGYALYENWYDSVYDYWLWYKNKPIKQHQSWFTYLRSRNYMNPGDAKK